MPHLDEISAQLDRLTLFDPGPFPVTSVYLNMQPDQHGRDNFEPFLRKELAERVTTFGAGGPERKSLEKDAEKIASYVGEVGAAVNGLAIFACSAADLFETVTLAAPIHEHRLFISDEPHLYPLARLLDEYPRYAVLLSDTHSARIFVFAANAVQRADRIENVKTKHHKAGGWSQARFQRHAENFHLLHAKEVIDVLGRIVRDEAIGSVILAGDEAIVPLLREQLPKELAERVVDIVKLEMRAQDREVLETTLAAMRGKDAETDRDRVEALLDAYRGNGLGVVGVELTRQALALGQVDELVIAAAPEAIDAGGATASHPPAEPSDEERAANELIVKARQTAARLRFIQDPALLEPIGGVGAFLRYKL